MIAAYGFNFGQPWWLLAALAVVPMVYLARRGLGAFGRLRRAAALALRVAVTVLLAAVLARPALTRTHDALAVLAVVDRSQSIPARYWSAGGDANALSVRTYMDRALSHKRPGDLLGVIDVAERAEISRLPSTAADLPKRTLSLRGTASRLADGLQLALAVAPPNTAVRILLITDGNETAGDLRAAARVAAANGIPIDVLPLHYSYDREVVFKRLVAPGRARRGQTIALRFVLSSTHPAAGHIMLTLNGRQVALGGDANSLMMPVKLKAGTNVRTISLPAAAPGVHQFDATFIPSGPGDDQLAGNNRTSAVTLVAGRGCVLVAAGDVREARPLVDVLTAAKMDVRLVPAGRFPTSLAGLLDADAVVLVDAANYHFTTGQQEMLCRYVTDLGGGLLTIGGPQSYGAGGWIGSPLAKILPVDMDPPQKKQMPKGALVLIMHACEMPRGNYWGKRVAVAAVGALSSEDYVGVLNYSWSAGGKNWVYPLSKAGDKKACIAAIRRMVMGDMPDFGAPMQAAWSALKAVRAGQKHVIIISDGDPSMPSAKLIAALRAARITCTGVAVFPHSPRDVASLQAIARATGGRFYNVQDPRRLPRIFVKEAQVIRRSLIIE
ncbi:MAG: VWA domain-containing protein, partial [Planctomycetes bacterium]|nr:VWA domain-containing protein [Planctomycetota bacterium]